MLRGGIGANGVDFGRYQYCLHHFCTQGDRLLPIPRHYGYFKWVYQTSEDHGRTVMQQLKPPSLTPELS
jgi:hypothetical protein